MWSMASGSTGHWLHRGESSLCSSPLLGHRLSNEAASNPDSARSGPARETPQRPASPCTRCGQAGSAKVGSKRGWNPTVGSEWGNLSAGGSVGDPSAGGSGCTVTCWGVLGATVMDSAGRSS